MKGLLIDMGVDFKTFSDFILQLMNSDAVIGLVGALSLLLTIISKKTGFDLSQDKKNDESDDDDSSETVNKDYVKQLNDKLDYLQMGQTSTIESIKSIGSTLAMVNDRLKGVEIQLGNVKNDISKMKKKSDEQETMILSIKEKENKENDKNYL